MNFVGRVFQICYDDTEVWNDTRKEKDLVLRDDVLLVVVDALYCRVVRLTDANIFHMCRWDVEEYIQRG